MIGANAMRARPGAAYLNDDQEALGASGLMPAARPAGAPRPAVVAPPAPWVRPANGLPGLPPSNDIGSHYQMHGRGPDGMFAGKKRNKSDKWREIAGVVGTALMGASGSPGFAPLMQMQMLRQRQRAEEAEAEREREAEFGQHDSLVQLLMRQGMSVDEAELAALQPDKLGEEYVSRFRTRDVSPNSSVYTPGLAGDPDSIWSAPSAESLKAKALGLKPGTPAYDLFMRDAILGAQGPTGYQMHSEDRQTTERGQDIGERNNIRSTSTSRENNIRSTDTARENKLDTPVATTTNERGETVIVYPDNRVTTARGSRDPRGGKRSGAAGGSFPEGTIIGNGKQKMIRRGGRWVPHS